MSKNACFKGSSLKDMNEEKKKVSTTGGMHGSSSIGISDAWPNTSSFFYMVLNTTRNALRNHKEKRTHRHIFVRTYNQIEMIFESLGSSYIYLHFHCNSNRPSPSAIWFLIKSSICPIHKLPFSRSFVILIQPSEICSVGLPPGLFPFFFVFRYSYLSCVFIITCFISLEYKDNKMRECLLQYNVKSIWMQTRAKETTTKFL